VVDDERRKHERYALWFPVRIEAGGKPEALGVTRDASRAAIRVSAATKLEVGERVTVTFSLPDDAQEHRVEGAILRMEPNSDDPHGLWPFRLTVSFDREVPELEALLKEGVEKAKG
jgi:hypothetical protein